MRQTRIPCQHCKKGKLIWQPSCKRYVCSDCGIEAEALPTWVASGRHRKSRAERAKQKRVAYVEEILGVNREGPAGRKKKHKKDDDQLEEEWKELIGSSED